MVGPMVGEALQNHQETSNNYYLGASFKKTFQQIPIEGVGLVITSCLERNGKFGKPSIERSPDFDPFYYPP